MTKPTSSIATVLIAAITLLSGCTESPYELAPVSGKVLIDGAPLEGVTINFQPIAQSGGAEPGPGSTGRCDATGSYTLETLHGEPGAVVGPHRVRIYGPKADTAPASDIDTGGSIETLPMRYNYRSELTFTAPPDGTEAADFDLTLDDPTVQQ